VKQFVGRISAACVAAVALGIADVCLGSAGLSLSAVWNGLWAGPASPEISARIVWDMRLPRLCLSALGGATLASAGALLQAATRNELADPFLFGLSSGAAAGAVAVIVFVGDALGVWTTAFGAALGALLSTGCLLLVLRATRGRASTSERTILSGLAISFLFSSVTNIMVVQGDRNTAQTVLFWTLGSFAGARWSQMPVALAGLAVVIGGARPLIRPLDALCAGDDTAASLGVDVARARRTALVISAVSSALIVTMCGPIAFIGLIVPNVARRLRGVSLERHFWITPVLGAVLAVCADLAARLMVPHQELPVGIPVSCLGAIFILFVLGRKSASNI